MISSNWARSFARNPVAPKPPSQHETKYTAPPANPAASLVVKPQIFRYTCELRAATPPPPSLSATPAAFARLPTILDTLDVGGSGDCAESVSGLSLAGSRLVGMRSA